MSNTSVTSSTCKNANSYVQGWIAYISNGCPKGWSRQSFLDNSESQKQWKRGNILGIRIILDVASTNSITHSQGEIMLCLVFEHLFRTFFYTNHKVFCFFVSCCCIFILFSQKWYDIENLPWVEAKHTAMCIHTSLFQLPECLLFNFPCVFNKEASPSCSWNQQGTKTWPGVAGSPGLWVLSSLAKAVTGPCFKFTL